MPTWTPGPRPTPEQEAVIQHIMDGTSNLLVNAVAGSGKTTTVVSGALAWAEAHPTSRALMCAFNTRIKDALVEKIGEAQGLEIRTLNSLGHRALSKIVPGRLQVDGRKTQTLAKGLFAWGEQPDLTRLVSILKMSGWIPHTTEFKGTRPVPDTNEIIDSIVDDFELDIDQEKPGFYENLRLLMSKSIAAGLTQGFIDFDDQLYLSVLWVAPFEKFPLIIVDEVQDVNWLQRRLIQLCLAPGQGPRVVGVGDRNQAIYAFRGAGYASMDEFKETFKCSELPLTFCFRCPQSVIKEAQYYVPQIQAPPWAPKGLVSRLEGIGSDLSVLRPTDAILCRNTRPLVSLCYNLIRRKIPATILGREIGDGLISLIKKIQRKGEEDLGPFSDRLQLWYEAQRKNLNQKGKENKIASLEDKVETILCLVDVVRREEGGFAPNGWGKISQLTQLIAQMFSPAPARLVLSTIHKAKGLEWPRVFFLDPHLIPSKYARSTQAIQQENNCIYVATTRAQSTLFYITSEKFFSSPKEPS